MLYIEGAANLRGQSASSDEGCFEFDISILLDIFYALDPRNDKNNVVQSSSPIKDQSELFFVCLTRCSSIISKSKAAPRY